MADWGKPFLTSFRFMRVDRASGNEVERITNIKNGGCIERNQDKDYTTGQVDYSGALDIGADLLRVYLDADFGGASVSEALGTFVVSAPKRTRRGVNSTGTGRPVGQAVGGCGGRIRCPIHGGGWNRGCPLRRKATQGGWLR